MNSIDKFKQLFTSSEKELEKIYFDFLRMPTISAEPEHRHDLRSCANWLEELLQGIGFQVEQWNKDDAPIIFASNCEAGPSKPTILIYNHYDVQPVDPIELWKSSPFDPQKKDDVITARGAQDNKGQCFYALAALKALYQENGSFPLNIKLCIEGEEESGSASLAKELKKRSQELKADYLLILDVGMKNAHTPAITLGTRGLAAFTVEVEGSSIDLHSGVHGGIVHNPLHALAKILSDLRDDSGQIKVPGFYETVSTPTSQELSTISFTFDAQDLKDNFGALATGGEKKFSPLERAWLRPTLEINGITGGYGGPGSKTVIPAKAQAKLSCRLVPDQDPQQISLSIKNYIESLAPEGITVTCTIHAGMGRPVRTSPSSKIIQALASSCNKVYSTPVEYIYEGASIPIVAELQEVSQSEVALFGLGLATDNIHAPNEHFGWDRIKNGFLILCETLLQLGIASKS